MGCLQSEKKSGRCVRKKYIVGEVKNYKNRSKKFFAPAQLEFVD